MAPGIPIASQRPPRNSAPWSLPATDVSGSPLTLNLESRSARNRGQSSRCDKFAAAFLALGLRTIPREESGLFFVSWKFRGAPGERCSGVGEASFWNPFLVLASQLAGQLINLAVSRGTVVDRARREEKTRVHRETEEGVEKGGRKEADAEVMPEREKRRVRREVRRIVERQGKRRIHCGHPW